MHGDSTKETSAVAASLLGGMVVGQVVGGALGDSFLGLTGALRVVMVLQIVASLGCATLVGEPNGCNSTTLHMHLALWRFFLGVGAGAVYPLAACLSMQNGGSGPSSEADGKSLPALRRVIGTFAVQGVGFLMVPTITLPLLYSSLPLKYVWRMILAVGCLPGIVFLVMQRGLPRSDQTPHMNSGLGLSTTSQPERRHNTDDEALLIYQELFQRQNSTDSSVQDNNTTTTGRTEEDEQGWWGSIVGEPNLGQKFIGTAFSWFFFDALFYGNTLFEPVIGKAAFGEQVVNFFFWFLFLTDDTSKDDSDSSPAAVSERGQLQRAGWVALCLSAMALPGYAVAGILLGKTVCGIVQSPRFVMLQGFGCMSLLFFSIGWFWNHLKHYPPVLVALYGLTFFFANYGPNTVTFLLPSLVYDSAKCRSTLNGLSAAAGKVGALTGVGCFASLAQAYGGDRVMLLCSGIALAGFVTTFAFVHPPQTVPAALTAE